MLFYIKISKVLGPENLNVNVNTILDTLNNVNAASAVFVDEGCIVKEEFVNASLSKFQAPVLRINVSDNQASTDLINRYNYILLKFVFNFSLRIF